MPLLVFLLVLGACGGSGSGGGIGGSGVVSSGTIDGFGSIFVNGVQFDTTGATIEIDGAPAREAQLGLGMVVTVFGTINADGVTGTADRVLFDDDLEGPLDAIEVSRDGDSALLTILGKEVIVERTGTVFDAVDFTALAVGDVLEISGFFNDARQLRATRVQKLGDFVPGVTEVEVKGNVGNLTMTTFDLDGIAVNYANADLTNVPGARLVEGQFVETRGVLVGRDLQASRVELEDGISDRTREGDVVSVQGTVTDFTAPAGFNIRGVTVDATGAVVSPPDFRLDNGVIVEVRGIIRGGVLVATEVAVRRGRIEVDAVLAEVDTANRRVVLRLPGGTVSVNLNARTQLEDDAGNPDPLRLADLRVGDFLQVEAIRSGGALVATRIDRGEPGDYVVQAPVDEFVEGASLTVLGIRFSAADGDFADRADEDVTAAQFYAALRVGDLVRIGDGRSPDGIADEVEFESPTDLDGGAEFEGEVDERDERDAPETR
ncbi:MAG: hypothetical protein HKN19_01555 [Halioglobus sp.]|nr:hypothetical protein [Halioglobus sp.]